jgi:hypothetical protein
VLLARPLDLFTIQMRLALPAAPIRMPVFFLAWKHLVGFLNEEMGVA